MIISGYNAGGKVPDGSVFFNGANQYLQIANAENFKFYLADYTVEFWMNPSSANTGAGMVSQSYSTSTWEFLFNWYAARSMSFLYTDDGPTSPASGITLNQWTHIAGTRASGTTRLFVNGTLAGTSSTVRDLIGATSTLIGWGGSTLNGNFHGYVSNVRIVKGTALYTGAFTPPTSPLTAIAGTSFLACQGTLLDNGPGALTIVAANSPAVSALSPFA